MGPNIKPLPEFEPLPDSLRLKLLLKLKDNVTTDDILPGGSKVMSLRSNLPAISEHVFALKSPEFLKKAKATDTIAILGGENYGQGSSREHASLAPRYLGVRAILALSFARLYRANLINFGIIPVLIKEEEYNKLEAEDCLELVDMRKAVLETDEITITVPQKDFEFKGYLQLSRREKEILLEGSCLNFYRHKLTENNW
jgi:aconitate hydratase